MRGRLRPAAGAEPDARCRQGARGHRMRRTPRVARLFFRQRQGRMDRPRRRLLPGAGRGRPRRRQQGEIHADVGAAALADPAIGPGRRALAQLDHHLLAQRHARPQLPGHQLLRGPDLHRPHQDQCQVGEGSRRRHGLRRRRLDGREERRRLVRGTQPQGYHRQFPEERRCDRRLRQRPVRRLHGRHRRARRPAHQAESAGGARDPLRSDLQRPAGSGDALGRRALAAHRALGAERHDRGGEPRRDLEERRRDEGQFQECGSAPAARDRGRLRCHARPRQRLDVQRHQAGRELRGKLRTHRRHGVSPEAQARRQRALDEGRPPVHAAVPVSSTGGRHSAHCGQVRR